jgi:hypothetical protein
MAKPIYQEIVNKYPNTRYWFVSKLFISVIEHHIEMQIGHDLLSEQNKIAMQIGGESIYKVANGQGDNFDIKSVQPQYREDLANFYYSDSSEFRDYNKTLEILQFIREKFPKFNWENIPSEIHSVISDSKGVTSGKYHPDNSPPSIRPIAPHGDHHCYECHDTFDDDDNDCHDDWCDRDRGERPNKIEARIEDGDISQTQVDLSKLVFTLDDKDLTDDMKVKSIINKSGKLRVTFEKLYISYYLPCDHPGKDPHYKDYGHCKDSSGRPHNYIDGFQCSYCHHRHCSTLSPGWHTVYIKAVDYGGHASEKTWRFYVKK